MALQKEKLLKRSVTGLLFGIIVLFLIMFSPLTRHIFIWLVAGFCALEYLQIRSGNRFNKPLHIFLALLAGPALSVINYLGWLSFDPMLPLVVLSVIYQLYLLSRLFFKQVYGQRPSTIALSAFLYIGFPLLLLNQELSYHPESQLLLVIVLIIWASDTFAYLTGSLFGKHKLFPAISPGKTWEGAIGGAIFAVIAGLLLHPYFPLGSHLFHIGLALVVWFFGLWGDLVESALKRAHDLKDSGNILPGHGGMLDRFDSFIYLIPFVLLFLYLF